MQYLMKFLLTSEGWFLVSVTVQEQILKNNLNPSQRFLIGLVALTEGLHLYKLWNQIGLTLFNILIGIEKKEILISFAKIIHRSASMSLLLFCSPKPRRQVRILFIVTVYSECRVIDLSASIYLNQGEDHTLICLQKNARC